MTAEGICGIQEQLATSTVSLEDHVENGFSGDWSMATLTIGSSTAAVQDLLVLKAIGTATGTHTSAAPIWLGVPHFAIPAQDGCMAANHD